MQLERDIGRLTGQIQAAGGDGVGEAHAAALEQRVIAERECARIQERIATLQFLRDTVSGCLAEGRERYYERGMSERTIQREWAIMRQTLNCHAAKSAL
jgi:hypothetical protein